MQTYADTYIEYWGEIYQKVNINEYDLSFDEFMTHPEECLFEIGQESAPDCIRNGFEPLMPKQAAVVLKLREKTGEVVCPNSNIRKSEVPLVKRRARKRLAVLSAIP